MIYGGWPWIFKMVQEIVRNSSQTNTRNSKEVSALLTVLNNRKHCWEKCSGFLAWNSMNIMGIVSKVHTTRFSHNRISVLKDFWSNTSQSQNQFSRINGLCYPRQHHNTKERIIYSSDKHFQLSVFHIFWKCNYLQLA